MSTFPRHALLAQSTPLEPLPRLSRHLNGPDIWIKRDDQTGIAFGGNKIRKLEYLLGQALAAGADTLVTIGGLQSNHCRQTAAVAARHGMACHLLLVEGARRFEGIAAANGNLLLDHLLGASFETHPDDIDRDMAMTVACRHLEAEGRRPFAMPAGGSTPIGALGYVDAADELLDQCDALGIAPQAIVHSSGSGGTQAGLICGFARAGRGPDVLGMSCGKVAPQLAGIVDDLAGHAADLLGMDRALLAPALVDDRHVGTGYGIPRADTWAAITLAARLEGLLLDPVYSGKAMAGLIDAIGRGQLPSDRPVVFLHTGGAPALFAYASEIGTLP